IVRGLRAPVARGFSLALLALVAAAPAAAQQPANKIGNYKVSTYHETYQPLSDDATFFAQLSPVLERWSYYAYQNLSIPSDFSFRFFGQQVKTIYVTGTGAIGIGNGTNVYGSDPLPSMNAPNGTLAPFWDMFGGSSWDDYQPGVRWEVTGE